jgi:hypothetical protein
MHRISAQKFRDHDRAGCALASGVIQRYETGRAAPEIVGLSGSPMAGINRAYAI